MKELNDNNFKEHMKDTKLVLVDFYATWCAPCSMQSKVLENIKKSRAINFEIVKVNVDESPNLAIEYNIDSIPTLMVFKENKLGKRLVGYTSEEEIISIMEEFEQV